MTGTRGFVFRAFGVLLEPIFKELLSSGNFREKFLEDGLQDESESLEDKTSGPGHRLQLDPATPTIPISVCLLPHEEGSRENGTPISPSLSRRYKKT